MVRPGMEASAEYAAAFYDDLGDDFAELAELPDDEALKITARWAMSSGDALSGLQLLRGATDRYVYNAARDTLVSNASREDGARFGREYNGDGKCDFCPMLASRGAVYLSAESAGETITFHDNCNCTISVERP